MFKEKFKIKKGFTLIEVIIAMAIVITFVAVLSQVYFVVLKTSTSNKQRLEALVLAENQLEKIRAEREHGTFSDVDDFKSWLVSNEGYTKESAYYHRSRRYIEEPSAQTPVNYDIKLYVEVENVAIVNEDYDDLSGSLMKIIIKVKPPNANEVSLGTKFFIK